MQREMNKIVEKTVLMNYLGELVRSGFENRKPMPLPEEIELEQLENIAVANQMTYMIISALLKLELPKDKLERFRAYIVKSTIKTLSQVCAIKEIQNNLEKSHIKHQMLKGSILKQLYPTPEMREMSDIDLMIYEENLERTESVLLDLGYTNYKNVKHHNIYIKNPGIVVEAHWSLYDKGVDRNQYLYYKNEFIAKLEENTEYTYAFSKEDFYVYMIAHMAKHFFETGCGIRNLIDIYIYNDYYKNNLDYAVIKETLNKLNLVSFEKHIRKLSNIWLGNEASTGFYNELFEYMLNCGIYGQTENGIWGQIAKTTKETELDKKIAIRNYFFPPYEYMKEHYSWIDGKPWLLPVGWMVRGIHAITDKSSKNRYELVKTVDDEKANTILCLYKELKLDFKNS